MTRPGRGLARSAAAVPYAEDGLFPPCPIAGCAGITEVEGHPCRACQDLFGEHLTRDPGGTAMTSEQVRRHKADTLAAYRAMLAPAATAEPERKQNQTCWICEERHTCTKVRDPHGMGWLWECDACREVPGHPSAVTGGMAGATGHDLSGGGL